MLITATALAASAWADPVTLSSGATFTPTFMDVKGQPLAGGNAQLGLGAIYVLGGGLVAVSGIPAGTVPLTIARQGQDIKISWDPKYVNPQIYVLTGDGTGKYTNGSTGWTLVAATDTTNYDFTNYSSTTAPYILHKNQVGLGAAEAYYKGLQAGVNPADTTTDTNYTGQTYLATAWAVGKVNVTVAASGGKQLVSLPLYDGTLSTIFPSQLTGGKSLIVSPRSGTGVNPVIVNETGVNGQDFTVGPMVGFWMQTPIAATAPVTITFVGSVISANVERDVEMKDLTGNPLPISFANSNLGVDTDIISIQSGLGLSPMIKSGGSWGQWTTVSLNQGFWYMYKANKRKWTVSPSALDVKIIQY